MSLHTTVAERVPTIAKVMLTCFVTNKRGLEFYARQGFARDEISPGPRRLRGKVVEPEYVILSKRVREDGGGMGKERAGGGGEGEEKASAG